MDLLIAKAPILNNVDKIYFVIIFKFYSKISSSLFHRSAVECTMQLLFLNTIIKLSVTK